MTKTQKTFNFCKKVFPLNSLIVRHIAILPQIIIVSFLLGGIAVAIYAYQTNEVSYLLLGIPISIVLFYIGAKIYHSVVLKIIQKNIKIFLQTAVGIIIR